MFVMNVLLQVASSRECRLTITTSVWGVISVYMQMKFQIGQLVESFIAQSAIVRLLAGVNQEVVAKIAFLMETFSADVANEFLLFAVSPYVRL